MFSAGLSHILMRRALVPVLLVLAFAACDADDELPARVRVVHAAPGAGPLDLLIDFEPLATDLAFGEASPYVSWEPGLRLLAALTPDAGGLDLTVEEEVIFDEDRDYTLFVTGFERSSNLVLLTDDRSTIAFGRARLRVVHGAPDAGPLAVRVAPEGGGAAVLSAADLNAGETTADVTVEEGRYTLRAEALGTGPSLDADLDVEERRRYVAVLLDDGARLTTLLRIDD